jgi:hypothetical protein
MPVHSKVVKESPVFHGDYRARNRCRHTGQWHDESILLEHRAVKTVVCRQQGRRLIERRKTGRPHNLQEY